MILLCDDCGNAMNAGSNFCTVCGTSRIKPARPAPWLDRKVKSVFAFYFILLVFFLAAGTWFGDEYDFFAEIMTSIVFIGISSAFILKYQDLIQPYLARPPSLPFTFNLVVLAIVVAIAVTLTANFLNSVLFGYTGSEIEIYLTTGFPFLYAVLFTCVIPAVFEELAFRGFMYRIIQDAHSEETAVIITSVLFAILHLSVIGLLWYIPLGFAMGYLRKKYKSLIYCMIVHFVYNFTIVLLEYYMLEL